MRYFIDYDIFDVNEAEEVKVFYGCGNLKCACAGKCLIPMGTLNKKKALEYLKEYSNYEFEKFIQNTMTPLSNDFGEGGI